MLNIILFRINFKIVLKIANEHDIVTGYSTVALERLFPLFPQKNKGIITSVILQLHYSVIQRFRVTREELA